MKTTACNIPYPYYPPTYPPTYSPSYPQRMPEQPYRPSIPNIYEQMGIDPVSRLAAAIEKLADALKEKSDEN